jgi:hypothetical protein
MASGIDSGKVTAVADVKGAQELGDLRSAPRMGRSKTADCVRGGSGSSENNSSRRFGGCPCFDADLVPAIDAGLLDPREGCQEELMIFRCPGLSNFRSRVLSQL